MMNKRFIYTLFFLSCAIAYTHAQGLRTCVCTIYPECTSADSLLLVDYAQHVARIGFSSDASAMRGHAGQSFGSGVLTEGCVLTNRHVVGYAKTVKLVFVLHDRTLTFAHCPVLSTSPTADIAAIALPNDMSALHPLPLSGESPQDGDEIFAAGFPGLNGEPSWQLSKGAISNTFLHVEENDYIQHTAAIDPGSSGGPLLRKVNGKYEVIGLNTLKAFQRDRVGMAVPLADIQAFLAMAPNTADQHLLDGFRDVDAELLVDYYRQLPDSMKTRLREMDVRLPMDRVVAIADFYGGVEHLQKKSEHKHLGSSKQADKRLTQNKPGVDHLRDTWSVYVSYDGILPMHPADESTWLHLPAINMEFAHGYLFYGMSLVAPMQEKEHFGYISGQDTIAPYMYNDAGLAGGLHIGAHVPIRINAQHVLVPRVSAGATMGKMFKSDDFVWFVPLRGGMDYRYQWKHTSFIIGAAYTFSLQRSIWGHSLSHGFQVHAGVAF